jgi:hypothetical protein
MPVKLPLILLQLHASLDNPIIIPLMRIYLKGIISVLLVLFFISCGTRSPKHVAEAYLSAIYKQDFEKAKTFGTEETNKMLDVLSGFAKMMPDTTLNKQMKFKILKEKIEGENATVVYREEGKNGEQSLPMVIENEKWKVAIGKEVMARPMDDAVFPEEEDSTVLPADTVY